MSATIITEGLRRVFEGDVGVAGLDLEAHPGEVLALLGPNGAGKTTTVRLLNGVLKPDAGSARVLGLDPSLDGEALRHRTGVLTENAGLDDRLTARENLRFAATFRGLRGAAIEARIAELIERFGMTDRADRLVQGASTGQRKRLGLAQALLHDPEVLFLDEPTSGLDPSATRDVIDLIGSLATDQGRTIVLCTHFLGEAGQLADRMAVLDRGHLVAAGRPSELAEGLWTGLACDIDLGGTIAAETVAQIGRIDDVIEVEATATGVRLQVRDRTTVAGVVRLLVEQGCDVYGATPRAYTLEDVYFEIEARALSVERSMANPIGAW